jgi:hypothetical protein
MKIYECLKKINNPISCIFLEKYFIKKCLLTDIQNHSSGNKVLLLKRECHSLKCSIDLFSSQKLKTVTWTIFSVFVHGYHKHIKSLRVIGMIQYAFLHPNDPCLQKTVNPFYELNMWSWFCLSLSIGLIILLFAKRISEMMSINNTFHKGLRPWDKR